MSEKQKHVDKLKHSQGLTSDMIETSFFLDCEENHSQKRKLQDLLTNM